jgi:hypothetical protein
MLLGACRVLFALRVITFAVVLSGCAMRFGGILVVFGCLVMFVFGHWLSPACLGNTRKTWGAQNGSEAKKPDDPKKPLSRLTICLQNR